MPHKPPADSLMAKKWPDLKIAMHFGGFNIFKNVEAMITNNKTQNYETNPISKLSLQAILKYNRIPDTC